MDKNVMCTRCVMDQTDPNVVFNEEGVCNHCLKRDRIIERVFKNTLEERQNELHSLVEVIKNKQSNKQYDCVVGFSGGVDSSYVLYCVKKLGLRPLIVHIDNGWNTAISENNVNKVLNKYNYKLNTVTPDWEEFKGLQTAFLRASVPDLEIPTDHAIWAVLFHEAEKNGIKYIISGMNIATETHLPNAWSHGHHDWRYIKGINKKFGGITLKEYPHMSISKKIKYRFIDKIERIDILNYFDYDKEEAKEILKQEFGWEDYGAKHFESVYTRFVQGYILPEKFGYDKRKVHLSSLICAGILTKEEALDELNKKPYKDPEMLQNDFNLVLEKLELTDEEFDKLMKIPNKSFYDYKSYEKSIFYNFMIYIYRLIRGLK